MKRKNKGRKRAKKKKKWLKKASFTWSSLRTLQGRYCREKERKERKNHHLLCSSPSLVFPNRGQERQEEQPRGSSWRAGFTRASRPSRRHIFLCRTLRKAISHTSSFPRGGRTHSGGHPSFRAPKPPEQAPLSAYNLPSRGAIVCHAVGTAVGFPRTLPTSLQITSNSREA